MLPNHKKTTPTLHGIIFVTYTPRHTTQAVDKIMKVQKDLFKGTEDKSQTDKSKLVPTNSKVLLT